MVNLPEASAVQEPPAADAAGTHDGEIRRVRLTLAVERWPGGGATLYGAAQGLFLALLRTGAADTAQALHDGQGRKRFALSPLRVAPGQGNVARAELDIAVWDAALVGAVAAGSAAALDTTLDVAGHPAHVLDVHELMRTSYAHLLATPRLSTESGAEPATNAVPSARVESVGQTAIWVRFVTPTVFSWGRGRDGRHRYSLLPAPELVVGSWLRAWTAGGGPALPIRDETDWLRDCICVHAVRSLRTMTVHTGKTPLSGFVGEIALDWCGAQPGARHALRTLAGFASYCGTGAKTAYGLGQTVAW
jgi:hypothetical protein